MEEKAWEISWLTSPHVKKPVKANKIFNYNKLVSESKKTDEEKAEEAFQTPEESREKQKASLRDKILKQAEREAKEKEAEENGN